MKGLPESFRIPTKVIDSVSFISLIGYTFTPHAIQCALISIIGSDSLLAWIDSKSCGEVAFCDFCLSRFYKASSLIPNADEIKTFNHLYNESKGDLSLIIHSIMKKYSMASVLAVLVFKGSITKASLVELIAQLKYNSTIVPCFSKDNISFRMSNRMQASLRDFDIEYFGLNKNKIKRSFYSKSYSSKRKAKDDNKKMFDNDWFDYVGKKLLDLFCGKSDIVHRNDSSTEKTSNNKSLSNEHGNGKTTAAALHAIPTIPPPHPSHPTTITTETTLTPHPNTTTTTTTTATTTTSNYTITPSSNLKNNISNIATNGSSTQ
jgi:hypothetical protein